jgi:hypothetical protein
VGHARLGKVAPARLKCRVLQVGAPDPGPIERAADNRSAVGAGPAGDHAGRLCIGLDYKHTGGGAELIFDPRTSALLGELETDAAGHLVGWAVYLQSQIVNGLPHRPPAPALPCGVHGGRSVQEPDGSTVMTG